MSRELCTARWFGKVMAVDGAKIVASLEQAHIGDMVSITTRDGIINGDWIGQL